MQNLLRTHRHTNRRRPESPVQVPCHRGRTGTGQRQRRGAIIPLAAFLIVGMMGFLAFSVDLGFLCLTKAELQTAADAAAHAAALELKDGLGSGGLIPQGDVEERARLAAVEIAAKNPNGDQAETSLNPDRDIRFGRREWDPLYGEWDVTWDVPPYNMVQITAYRQKTDANEINLFFAPVIGHQSSELSTRSVSFVWPGGGFRIPSGDNDARAMVLPIALDEESWNVLFDNPSAATDNFTIDPETGDVSSGPDGIPEVNLYPTSDSSLPPGNRGTVDIGSDNNSTQDIARQILEGLSANDLSYFPNNELNTTSGSLQLNGDTGLSAGIQDELTEIIGETRAIPLFTEVNGNGNNAVYTISRFVGVRILSVRLTGPMNKKHVIVQPAPFSDPNIIRAKLPLRPDSIFATPATIQ